MENIIPLFPNFKPLELTDKIEITNFTKHFPSTSDYYFAGWWAWDVENLTQVSWLNGNLVARRIDYTTGNPFYSFLGVNKVEETANLLIDQAKNEGISEELKLIIGLTIEKFEDKDDWNVLEDPENNDYLLVVEKICTMQGSDLHSKRKKVNSFVENYDATVRIVGAQDLTPQKELLEMWEHWSNKAGKKNVETEQEHRVFERMSRASQYFETETLCVYIDGSLEGFIVFEDLKDGNAVSSFEKGNANFKGIYEYMKFKLANYLKSRGCRYINIEQDLGKEGLRAAKSGYAPEYLKKYKIIRKDAI